MVQEFKNKRGQSVFYPQGTYPYKKGLTLWNGYNPLKNVWIINGKVVNNKIKICTYQTQELQNKKWRTI